MNYRNAAWALVLALATGCSGRRLIDHGVHSLIPSTLRIRRPAGPPATPVTSPGGIDFESHPRPDRSWDCQRPEALFRGIDLGALRSCVETVKKFIRVEYYLIRDPEPFLLIEPDDDNPACLGQVLPRIPVPREIFFQSEKDERIGCYSMRAPIDDDEWMGAKLPRKHLYVTIDLPLDRRLRDDSDTIWLLSSWAILPIWREAPGRVRAARVVPDSICQACLGVPLLRTGDRVPEPWP